MNEEEWKKARLAAYRMLAMRNYPSVILKKKLRAKEFSEAVCERVIEELKRLGYLKDEEVVQSEILREFQRGHGPRYIESKFRFKGLDERMVRKIVTEEMQREKIRQMASKLLAKGKLKAMQALFRRGFDPEIIRSVEIFS